MKKIYIVIIFIIAVVLRLYKIDSVPPSLTWDEVAWGYNAYSIGIDGKDEFGKFLPLDYIESFGDFKPPVYAYLTVLPVKVFGLNEFSVRVPSAFFGALTVLVTYYLVIEIFGGKSNSMQFVNKIGLLASFLLAISPWHINLSRAAFEANISSFFIVSGIWLFLYAVRKNILLLHFSAIFFVLSLYTFNTARIVTPFLVLILGLFHIKDLLKHKYNVVLSIILGLLLILPTAPFLLSPQATLRFEEVNIFSDISIIERTNQQIFLNQNVWWSKIIHNRRFAYGVEYLRHYLDNFSPQFLFIKGDGNPKFSTQDVGQLYLWELPFLLLGLLLIIRNRDKKWWLIPVWIIIGVIPAATARETPHALRIETLIPTLQILTAYGVVHFLSLLRIYIQSTKFKRFNVNINMSLSLFLSIICILSLVYYLHGYYVFYPKEYSGEWQYGYKDAISFVNTNYNYYDRIYITEGLGRPYIYFLFYTKFNPRHFRETAKIEREALGFVHVNSFDKYYFAKDISTLPKGPEGEILYINVPSGVPENVNILKTFNLINGDTALVAYTL